MKKATVEDVARAAGVSTFTVSRALRDMQHVAPATKEKVLKAAEELQYTASKSAAALASGQTSRIALLCRERIAGWFMGELMDGLYDVLSPLSYDITVYRAGDTRQRKQFFTRLPANSNADAIILTGFSVTEQEQSALTDMGMPIVLVNSKDTGFSQGSVAVDDEDGEASAVRYLAALGHHRFCYVGRVDPLTSKTWGFDVRIRGYQNVIEDLGLIDCGAFHIDSDTPRSSRQAVASILSLSQRPTAICVWSDFHALSIVHELTKAGIRIPQDMSVIGFDGSDISAATGLSTIAQPARDIGRIAAKKALHLIAGEDLDEAHTTVPTTLEPRETTGPIRDNT